MRGPPMRERWRRAGLIRWGGKPLSCHSGAVRNRAPENLAPQFRDPGFGSSSRPGMTSSNQSACNTRPRVSGNANAAMKNTA
ncbi:hypothetical protein ACVIW2_005620 [Bradyrhizobium huanghuaihaiense]